MCHLDQRELYQQALVAGCAVIPVAVVAQLEGAVEQFRLAALSLLVVVLAHTLAHIEQGERLLVAAHEQVAEVGGQSANEVVGLEPSVEYVVELCHGRGNVAFDERVGHAKVFVVVEHVEVFDHLLVGDVPLAVACHLVEDGERIAHAAIGLFGNDVQCFGLVGDALLASHIFEVLDGVGHGDACKVVYLAAAQYGGHDFVLFGSGKHKYGVCGRLFKRFEKGIECSLREHVHLVDDKHLVASYLWGNLHLFNQSANVVDTIVRCGIKLVYVV
ncbi:dNA polymerase subunits gamma and tau [Prevotella sp. CAG:5226]|nr:dNA polymerase subunits gamma and tau [Prevotella sp. CAG:5226]